MTLYFADCRYTQELSPRISKDGNSTINSPNSREFLAMFNFHTHEGISIIIIIIVVVVVVVFFQGLGLLACSGSEFIF
jgi:hypothetical protein